MWVTEALADAEYEQHRMIASMGCTLQVLAKLIKFDFDLLFILARMDLNFAVLDVESDCQINDVRHVVVRN